MGKRSGFAEFEIGKDDFGRYRWTFVSPRGAQLAVGPKSFATRASCKRALDQALELASIEPRIVRFTA